MKVLSFFFFLKPSWDHTYYPKYIPFGKYSLFDASDFTVYLVPTLLDLLLSSLSTNSLVYFAKEASGVASVKTNNWLIEAPLLRLRIKGWHS